MSGSYELKIAPLPAGDAASPVLHRIGEMEGQVAVCYRQAGDRYLLVEYGPQVGDDFIHGRFQLEVEVWALPREQVGSFLQLIPAPLGLGKLELQDGRWVSGFICEPYALDGARDVTRSGGWRHYFAESME